MLKQPFSVIQCPNCEVCTPFSAALSSAPFNETKVEERVFVQEAYTIYECSHCGLLFKYPAADAKTLDNYYATVDYRRWFSNIFYPTELLILQELEEVPVGGSILDFGCSSGRLLTPLVSRYRCYGFEPNAVAAKNAAEVGLAMLPNLELSSFPPALFDAIVLVDVFEHLSSPSNTLDLLLARLAPGGRLILSTGNGDAPACRCDPARFWYFRNIEHLCMLTRRYIEMFAVARGLRITSWKPTSHYHSHWHARLFQYVRHFAYWSFHAPIPTFWRSLLLLLPYLRRAKNWREPPFFCLSKDHVVISLRRSPV